MKNYTITVNGTAYNVTVEENKNGAPQAAPVQAASAPQAAPAAATPAPQAAQAASAGSAGGIEVAASLPGKVFSIPAKAGDAVKAGDSIVVLEAMKMEVPVVAPQDGIIASIEVAVGDAVEAGSLLATMN